ncbi:anaphase-promoting complex subunit cdc27 [Coemansia sp. RSA 455]|nr:anaphase-promoting complex subunit cdc27 [Coemansia sp. RSA 455]
MLGQPADAQNRLRSTKIGGRTGGTRSTGSVQQQQESSIPKVPAFQSIPKAEALSRPLTEQTRHYYEALISRGIRLLQPHSVLSIAETYHAWYHSSTVDVAGSILHQTLGHNRQHSLDVDGYDIRSIYWLALCYWHMGEVSTVYALLSPSILESEDIIEKCETEPAHSAGESPKLRSMKALACSLWVLAMSCTRLDKWQEAEDHLNALSDTLRLVYLPDEPGHTVGADIKLVVKTDASLYTLPTLSDVSDLLGLVCMRTNRVAQSEAHSLEAVRRNQLQWSSCRRLCELGHSRVAEALAVDLDQVAPERVLQRVDSLLESTPVPASRLASRMQGPGTVQQKAGPKTSQLRQPGRSGIAQPGDEPASARAGTRSRTIAKPAISAAAALVVNASGRARATLGQKSAAGDTVNTQRVEQGRREAVAKTPGRARIDELVSEKKRTRNGSAVRSASLSREPSLPAPSTVDRVALAHVHGLVERKASAYSHMHSYRATQALASFAALSVEQQNSAWGLCMLGRICFEAGRYPEAAQAFDAAHQLAPYRMRDMDIYSTLLWHMKREETLAQLAHAMVSAGRNWSPEAWIAVANCFSLDGDHLSALRSLSRSIQLYRAALGAITPRSDSGGVGGLAYAHTLVGHENVANDELDRAQQAFRTAIRIDARHYNAWYGMGMVYLRLGKLDLAEYHFKRALALNAQNPLLLQSAGALFEARADYPHALEVYERVERLLNRGQTDAMGSELRVHHAMNFVMFKRARVLVVLERFADAALVLEQLLSRCPREFNVPFLLGQTYTKLRRYREAAACLTRSLDIAPENGHSVREAFDALYMEDAEEQKTAVCLPPNHQNTPAASLLSPGSVAAMESPESPSLYSGRRAEWNHDWRSLNNADDRVARAFDLDT